MIASKLLDSAAEATACDPLALTGGGAVILLAPHPDDETLGCGQAIAALTDAGVCVQLVLVTDGSQSHPKSQRCPPPRMARLRARELKRAWRRLTGGTGPAPVLLGYPDRGAPEDSASRSAACDRIAPLIDRHSGALWASWAGDPHCDHVRVARLATDLHARHRHLARWSYPIWGRFNPALPAPSPDEMALIDPGLAARKRTALAAHASQMTGLIPDDPTGFVMQPEHQRHFIDHPEIFIRETLHA